MQVRFVDQILLVVLIHLLGKAFAEVSKVFLDPARPDRMNQVVFGFSKRQQSLCVLLGTVPAYVVEFEALLFE